MSQPAETLDAPRPRRLLHAAAVVGGCAIAIATLTVGTSQLVGAVFTSQATVTGQAVTAATVEIDAAMTSGSTPISVPSMLPGDTTETSIALSNTGSEAVYYTVRLPQVEDTDVALAAVLEITVTVGSDTETRTLAAWQGGALQIGPALAAGDTRSIALEVELPSGASNALQGLEAGFSVQVDAIQARRTTAPTAGWVTDPTED